MKTILSVLALALFVSNIALAESSVDANNCEVFVDKALATIGSHAGRSITFYVKTLPWRMDSQVVEVGMRFAMNGTSGYNGGTITHPWINVPMNQFMGAGDYYQGQIATGSDFGSGTYQMLFYAKTANGTFYWAKSANGGNFIVDDNGWHNIMSAMGYPRSGGAYNWSSDIRNAANTQSQLPYYNPQGCR